MRVLDSKVWGVSYWLPRWELPSILHMIGGKLQRPRVYCCEKSLCESCFSHRDG